MAFVMIALSLLGWAAWYLLAAPKSQWMCPVISAGRRDRKILALTFDDGPGNDTRDILHILGEKRVKATFFLCGANVEKFPEVARQIAHEGHAIGNHAYSHRNFIGKPGGWMREDIDQAAAAIQMLMVGTPSAPLNGPGLFRPPYGIRWFGLNGVLEHLKLETVMWDVNSEDWKRMPEDIARKVIRDAKPGSIILLHDGIPPQEQGTRANTVKALPAILAELSKSYEFVTVPQLIAELRSRS
jgi:peptidoglycan/xylan/chitin deacetylase (PgdA/CDA1 family)